MTTTLIDPSDLLDAGEVAALLGLSMRQAVSTYRTRYSDFPVPIVSKNSGKCDLWLRSDIETWAAGRKAWLRHMDLLATDEEYATINELGQAGEPHPDLVGNPRSDLLDRAWRLGRDFKR